MTPCVGSMWSYKCNSFYEWNNSHTYQWLHSHPAGVASNHIEKPINHSNCFSEASIENKTYWKTKVACALLMLHNPSSVSENLKVKCTTCALLRCMSLMSFWSMFFLCLHIIMYIVLSWSSLIPRHTSIHQKLAGGPDNEILNTCSLLCSESLVPKVWFQDNWILDYSSLQLHCTC